MKSALAARLALVLSIAVAGAAASAQSVTPQSYTSFNGAGDSYRDDTYPGCPCTVNSVLSGGIGQLADGIWTNNRFDVGYPFPNEWVGWNYNPAFIFHFAAPINFTMVRLHVDFAGIAGLGLPNSVFVGESSGGLYEMTNLHEYTPDVPGDYGRYWVDFDVSNQGLNGVSDLAIALTRDNWIFIDEFEFRGTEGEVAPEPASLVLVATGLLGLAGVARKSNSKR